MPLRRRAGARSLQVQLELYGMRPSLIALAVAATGRSVHANERFARLDAGDRIRADGVVALAQSLLRELGHHRVGEVGALD
mmetsp:Transcript_22884/g.39108  ORF Transcript_22884/g.39108 Transcript_22884/m.39108 type:complete len:81 (-) Transcript_22884:472-714(-)